MRRMNWNNKEQRACSREATIHYNQRRVTLVSGLASLTLSAHRFSGHTAILHQEFSTWLFSKIYRVYFRSLLFFLSISPPPPPPFPQPTLKTLNIVNRQSMNDSKQQKLFLTARMCESQRQEFPYGTKVYATLSCVGRVSKSHFHGQNLI